MSDFKRAPNFSSEEEQYLVLLVKQRKEVLECKRTDVNSTKAKSASWVDLAAEFNANNGIYRDEGVLRRKYENIKKRCKKNYADEKALRRRTGGGPAAKVKVTTIDETMLELLGNQVTGITSEFDDDAVTIEINPEEIPMVDVSSGSSDNLDETITATIDSDDWGNYNPGMLRKPRSTNLMPTWLQLKLDGTKDSSNNQDAETVAAPLRQSFVLKEVATPSRQGFTPKEVATPSRKEIAPNEVATPSSHENATPGKSTLKANEVWAAVGQAKSDLIELQRNNLVMERVERRREHLLKMKHMRMEHSRTMKILKLQAILLKKRQKLLKCKNVFIINIKPVFQNNCVLMHIELNYLQHPHYVQHGCQHCQLILQLLQHLRYEEDPFPSYRMLYCVALQLLQ